MAWKQAVICNDCAKKGIVHVVLTCANHPDLRWHTKNITPIGSRSIFYDNNQTKECDCPVYKLVHLSICPNKQA